MDNFNHPVPRLIRLFQASMSSTGNGWRNKHSWNACYCTDDQSSSTGIAILAPQLTCGGDWNCGQFAPNVIRQPPFTTLLLATCEALKEAELIPKGSTLSRFFFWIRYGVNTINHSNVAITCGHSTLRASAEAGNLTRLISTDIKTAVAQRS